MLPLVAVGLGFVLIFFHKSAPPQPPVIVPLSDGSALVLSGTDTGPWLAYGGHPWPKFLCKALKRQLPGFIRYQPLLYPSFYTNGVALLLSRRRPDRTAVATAWNGTGQLYFLDDAGLEQLARYHGVNFNVEPWGVAEEQIAWEIPILRARQLNLLFRETNQLTGAISTHHFQINNPALRN
jgi:hypothetical protein